MEYEQIEAVLVKMAMGKLGISERVAKIRIRAIIKSGILSKFGPPDGVPFQAAIDASMQIPQLGEKE